MKQKTTTFINKKPKKYYFQIVYTTLKQSYVYIFMNLKIFVQVITYLSCDFLIK